MKDNTRIGLAITAGVFTGLLLTGLSAVGISKIAGFVGDIIVDASFAVGKAILKKDDSDKIVED